jgi:hypothetical protein
MFCNIERVDIHGDITTDSINYAIFANGVRGLCKQHATQFISERLFGRDDLSVDAEWCFDYRSNKFDL